MQKGTLVAVTAMMICWAGGCGGSRPEDPAMRTAKVYDLIAALPAAKLQAVDPIYLEQPKVNQSSIAKDIRPILAMHAPSSVEFPPIAVTADSILFFGFGLTEQAWDHAGDGVEFSVFVRLPNGTQTKVFSKYIDPKHNADERHWFNERVSLEAFAAPKTIQITLMTSAGPAGDNNSDWAVWGEPQVVIDRGN